MRHVRAWRHPCTRYTLAHGQGGGGRRVGRAARAHEHAGGGGEWIDGRVRACLGGKVQARCWGAP